MHKKRQHQVSIRDVAEKSGVSYPVASLILSDKKSSNVRYSEITRKRVLNAAAKMGYRPNRLARNFVQGRSGVIDVIIDSIYQLPLLTLQAMLLTAEKEFQQLIHLDMRLTQSDWKPLCIRENAVDGVLLVANTDVKMDHDLDKIGLPVVNLNCNLQNTNGSIYYDESGAIEMAVAAFKKQGRKRVVYLQQSGNHYSGAVREKTLQYVSKKKGLKKPFIIKYPEQLDRLTELLEKHSDIDSLICHEDWLGSVYRTCIQEKRKIGVDFSVICMHPAQIAPALQPSVSGLALPDFDIGQLAIRTLNKLIRGEKISPQIVKYELKEGESI